MARRSAALCISPPFRFPGLSGNDPRTFKARLGSFLRHLALRTVFIKEPSPENFSRLDLSGIFRPFRLAVHLFFRRRDKLSLEIPEIFKRVSATDFSRIHFFLRVLLCLVASDVAFPEAKRLLDFQGTCRSVALSKLSRLRRSNFVYRSTQAEPAGFFVLQDHRTAQPRSFYRADDLRLSVDGYSGKVPVPRTVQRPCANPLLCASLRRR